MFNGTEPTDSDFTLGTKTQVNKLDDRYVAYLFADTPGLIKCGADKCTNGSASVTTGFRPGWLLLKVTTGSGSWIILDKKRGDFANTLYPNLSEGEATGGISATVTDTGFTLDNYGSSTNNNDFIYVAIKEGAQAGQFPPSRKAFSTTTYDGDGIEPRQIKTGIDNTSKSLIWVKNRSTEYSHYLFDSERVWSNGITLI